MKKLNDLINNLETYKELTTVPRDTLIKELKECKEELTEQLRLHSVSQHRELLIDFFIKQHQSTKKFNELVEPENIVDEYLKGNL
jgi:hypothetical protein